MADQIEFNTDDSEIVEEESTPVEDEETISHLTKLLEGSDLKDRNTGMVEYKGVMMKADIVKVVKHTVDKMLSHFRDLEQPKLTFTLKNLSRLPYNDQYKSKNEEPSDRWYSQVGVRYNIDGESLNFEVFGIDGIYLDLIPKTTKNGGIAKNYGRSWVNMYIPTRTFRTIVSKFQANTNWKVSSKGLTVDESQGLSSVVVSISEDSPPNFYVIRKVLSEETEEDGAVRITVDKQGTVQRMCSDPDYQQIYKGTAFVTASITVPTAVGTTNEPLPSPTGPMARLKFSLVSIKAYGLAEDVKPVHLGQKRLNPNIFG